MIDKGTRLGWQKLARRIERINADFHGAPTRQYLGQAAPDFDLARAEDYLGALLNGALAKEAREHEEWRNLPPSLPMIVIYSGDDTREDDGRTNLDDDIPF